MAKQPYSDKPPSNLVDQAMQHEEDFIAMEA
jgi:hypothetical protein